MTNQGHLLIDPGAVTVVIFLYLESMGSCLLKSTFTIMLMTQKSSEGFYPEPLCAAASQAFTRALPHSQYVCCCSEITGGKRVGGSAAGAEGETV
ncbi:hypothetical protein GDO81_022746 [Engystomops pustulosus]|uniref:Uncharacterized protein n=1 Tax=Engystomops pustulosus TaxID=76066 RepID=A0AAV6YWP8_ENGPU|nr:hypothetical protein GDO81_022746 [Engystomops pustulosus]